MWPVALVGAGVALAYATTRGPKNTVELTSRVNGRKYRVQNLPDKQAACDRMASIHDKLDKLIDYYKSEPSMKQDAPIQAMIGRFRPENMSENDMESDSTSYSENKGDKIVVCLRDKTDAPNYPLVDENTVMFVMLHEMAHLMTTTIGHTPEFWTNFRRLLKDAIKCGVYSEVNYAKQPVAYCGMTITDSPL